MTTGDEISKSVCSFSSNRLTALIRQITSLRLICCRTVVVEALDEVADDVAEVFARTEKNLRQRKFIVRTYHHFTYG